MATNAGWMGPRGHQPGPSLVPVMASDISQYKDKLQREGGHHWHRPKVTEISILGDIWSPDLFTHGFESGLNQRAPEL